MSEHSGERTVAELLNRRITEAGRSSPALLKVIRFIERNPGVALTSSAAELARQIGLSDATVIRAVQALGFEGMAGLRQTLATALQGSSLTTRLQRTFSEVGEDAGRAIDVTLEAHREALDKYQSPEVREKLVQALRVLAAGERIVVFGIGPSSWLAGYAAMLLARMGRQARSLDRTGIGLADQLLDLRVDDALLLLAYGRAYPEVTATIAEARRLAIPIVLVTDSLEARLAKRADVIVPAQRGRAGRVALHGATLLLLEALVLGLAAMDRQQAMRSLEQLNALRAAITGSDSLGA
jgi:DNA-binding MurR/RpiR family transcriptional regulator